ncbi:hypothetical protein AAG747_14955 [Rapidithrix thailandica]|uniref:Uncharacterized protein n=1 Tax=Rapidithrix thailandica TaxID=413964 RepID=A0AAW9SED5_9BACT
MRTLKSLTFLLMLAIVGMSFANAQTSDEWKDARKIAGKKAIKDARKQAKKFRKQGFMNLPGEPNMDKQIEEAMILNYVRDDKGRRKFYYTTQEAKAETFAAAKQQAQQLCLADIASQIGSNILGRIKSNVANAEQMEDAASVTEVIGAYQNTVAAKLGRTEPVVLFTKKDKLTYIYMGVLYDVASAEEMIKNDLRKELKSKTELLQEEIDGLLELK